MAGTSASNPEAKRICNLVPSRDTQRDWRFEHAVASGALGAVAALPPSVDLRADWWGINDQESTGSCVGWASTDGVARYSMVMANRLGQNELLSPRYTWMASKEFDEFNTRPESFIEEAGTSLKSAMDVLRKYGAVPEKLLPFHINTTMYAGNENDFFATASQRRIAAYFNLNLDFNQWRTWLATRGPIMAGLQVDATWDHAADTQGKLDTFQPRTVSGGHAVCVVGYRTDGRFIIRNSWGKNWGDKGFAYASEEYLRSAFFPESYGVTV
jgi:C1A family cysteine protease